MLLVGSILPAGAGQSLWQLAGAAPANIELNTSAGAAGILAEMPADNNFKLSLTDTNPDIPFLSGYIYHVDTVNNILSYVGVSDFGGGVTPNLGKRNSVSQSAVNIIAPNENSLVLTSDNILGDNVVMSIQNANAFLLAINNNTGDAGARIIGDLNSLKLLFHDNATNQILTEFLMDSQFNFRDGLGAYLFRISGTGQLQTNQTAASIAVRVKTAEMPIYNQAGVLVGYIDINT